MPLTSQNEQAVFRRLDEALDEVSSRFAAELISDLPCVNTLTDHVEQYRGKMLRPRLVLVAAMAGQDGDPDISDAHYVLATVVEMVHMATLVHDDILDDSEIRRRGHTMNHLEGNETAVMLGDYLISHAYHLCSSLADPSISRAIAETTNIVCEGELLQLANRNNWALDEQTYFEIIRRKTSALTASSCRLGALLCNTGEGIADCLYEYGEKVGIAFQIVDDLLDLVGDPCTVGKTLGRDLEKGKLTLPLIRFLATADADDRTAGLAMLQNHNGDRRNLDHRDFVQIRQWITASSAVDYATEWAARLIDQAKTSLQPLADSPAKALLKTMADTVLTRRA